MVSGGAPGVDTTAEQTWLALGGQVESYRPKMVDDGSYGIEKWELGGARPRVYLLLDQPTWVEYGGACFFRDWLIAESSDRLAAFYRRGKSSGTRHTVDRARALGKPVFEFEAGTVIATT